MGRGLGPLQRRVLAMANYNRLSQGGSGDVSYQVDVVADFDEKCVGDLFDSHRYIQDRFKQPWRYEDCKQIATWWDFLIVIEESGLVDKHFLLPGTRSGFYAENQKRRTEVNDKLVKAGMEKIHHDVAGGFPTYDLWPGRHLVSWTYRKLATLEECDQLLTQMIAAGFPGDSALVVNSCSRVDCHLTFAEGLADLFSFREHIKGWHRRASQRRIPAGPGFDRKQIGKEPYRAASVSLSKAFAALAKRGLVLLSDFQSGMHHFYKSKAIRLTQKGIAEAERIVAADPDILADIPLYAVPICPEPSPCEIQPIG